MEQEHESLTPEEQEEERRFQEATNEQGDFKSLGHRLEYFGSIPADFATDGPNPFSVPDTPEQEEAFHRSVEDFRHKRATAQGVKEALQSMQPSPPPLPDDPYAGLRAEAAEWERDCMAKAADCELSGDALGVQKWKDRAKFKKKDLERLPPTPAEVIVKDAHERLEDEATDLLFKPEAQDNPVFQTERMQLDSATLVAKANRAARNNTIKLPQEKSPWGDVMECRPGTMIKFELPPAVAEEFKRTVYQGGDPTPSEIFKKSWSFLRKKGYAASGKVMKDFKLPSEDPNTTDNPEKMSWSRYNEWRTKQEDEKRGGPRKPFAIPRPRKNAW